MKDVRYEQEAKDQATGILEQFVDAETLAPKFLRTVEDVGLALLNADPRKTVNSLNLANKTRSAQRACAQRANDEDTKMDFGYVGLDIDGLADRPWLSVTAPAIVFCGLSGDDTVIPRLAEAVCGFKPHAMALYFDPEVAGTRDRKDQAGNLVRNHKGEVIQRPNEYNPMGYLGFVGFYPTFEDAARARDELVEAVRIIAAPPADDTEADTEDVSLEALVEAGELDHL